MINKLNVSILLRGEGFSPQQAEVLTGLKFKKKIEAGESSPIREKQKLPISYGSAIFEAPEEIPVEKMVMWLVNKLQGKLEQIYNCGAEETRILAGYFYENQCNLSFSKEELRALANLGIDLWITCYDVSDNE